MTLESYNNAVDKLLDAYNKKELFHGRCEACAVGNLFDGNQHWVFIIGTLDRNMETGENVRISIEKAMKMYPMNTVQLALAKVKQASLGISDEELMAIEDAFESAYTGDQSEHTQLAGLTAVLNVMKDMVEENVPHQENVEKLNEIYELQYS